MSLSVQLTPWPAGDLQGKFAEADSLYERAAHIWDKTYGLSHPTTGSLVRRRATLAEKQVRGEVPSIDCRRWSASPLGLSLAFTSPSSREKPLLGNGARMLR